jgi:hypothetical protein
MKTLFWFQQKRQGATLSLFVKVTIIDASSSGNPTNIQSNLTKDEILQNNLFCFKHFQPA